jgi:hypothetical protein
MSSILITQWVLTAIAQWVLSGHLNRTPDMQQSETIDTTPHRRHSFDIREAATERSANLRLLACIAASALALFAFVFGFFYLVNGGAPTAAKPVQRAMVVELRPESDTRAQRDVIARLEDWRAGYEAAVENGCKVQPMLSAPLGRSPGAQ